MASNALKIAAQLAAMGNAPKDYVDTSVPVVTIQAFASETPPKRWLSCDGSEFSRTECPSLFAVLGVTYGAGDGSTTANLPDLRGEFLRGWDGGRGVDAGRPLGSAQAHNTEELYAQFYVDGSMGGNTYDGFGRTIQTPSWSRNAAFGAGSRNAGGNTNWGSGVGKMGEGETRPRNVAVHYCIFVGERQID